MKRFKRILALFLTLAVLSGCCACSPGSSRPPRTETLRIAYYSPKYGDAWIKSLAAAFQKKHPALKIVLDGDSRINSNIRYTLMSGANEPDIAFVSQTNWEQWADKGYMADLSGVYAAKTDGGALFRDKLQPGLLGYARYRGVYRIVPWGDGVTGLIYNQKMFEDNGWCVPTTVKALSALLARMRNENITPLAWGGQDMGYWNQAVNTWWAQCEGTEGMRDYLKMDSSKVYDQQGRLVALTIYEKIVENPLNSVDNPAELDSQKAIQAFYGGKAAMMPGGYLTLMETQYRPPKGFRAQMMELPAMENAKQPNTCSALAGDFAFIPSGAENAQRAEEFLSFMANNQELSLFTACTGCPAPFVYHAEGTKGLDSLAASEAALWRGSEKVYRYSASPVYYGAFLDWPFDGSPLMRIYSGGESARQAFENNYNYVATNWDDAVKQCAGGE